MTCLYLSLFLCIVSDIYSSLYTAITFPAYTPSFFTPVVPIALHSQKSINTAPPMSVALAEQFSLDMASVPYEDLMEAVDVAAVHRVFRYMLKLKLLLFSPFVVFANDLPGYQV